MVTHPRQDTTAANRRWILGLGVLATIGALLGVVADVLSGWSAGPHAMDTPLSVDLESIRGLYANKPRWTWVAGNYVGVVFIPLHLAGLVLVHAAMRPASERHALCVLGFGAWLVSMGTAYHGSFAFVGDILSSGDARLVDGMLDYWQPWGAGMAAGYALFSLYLAGLVASGRSLYPRWMVVITPLGLVTITSLLAAALPQPWTGVRAFLTVTGLNLPLMVLFAATTWLLMHRGSPELGFSLPPAQR